MRVCVCVCMCLPVCVCVMCTCGCANPDVQVWGVKKSRPVFTYRVREPAALVVVELSTNQVCV